MIENWGAVLQIKLDLCGFKVHEDLEGYSSLSNLVLLKQLLNYSVLIGLKKALDFERAKFGLYY